MTEKHDLIAYLATLLAIVVLVGIAAYCAAHGKLTEAVGVGAAVTGLIGVMRMPTQRHVTVDNSPANPVPVDPDGQG